MWASSMDEVFTTKLSASKVGFSLSLSICQAIESAASLSTVMKWSCMGVGKCMPSNFSSRYYEEDLKGINNA